MVSAASLNESTLSRGFFESTGAAVTWWASGSLASISRLASLTRRIPNVAMVLMVLLLKRFSCFRKCCVFFFQQDLSICLNAFADPSPWSVDSGIRPRRGV